MPKRSHETEYLKWKLKRLKKKIKRAQENYSSDDEVGALLDSPRSTRTEDVITQETSPMHPVDRPLSPDLCVDIREEIPTVDNHPLQTSLEKVIEPDPAPTIAEEDTEQNNNPTTDPDPELLEILGADPSTIENYGPNINKDLATRLQHIATTGFNKDTRKELTERYLIPANSTLLGAPVMNPEIKAALTETVLKRDKGIEVRQNQLAAAITGLARVISSQLDEKKRNNERLKQTMDVCRILCNIQHDESVIRRNFAIFSIKKEMKDHLSDTKIDKYLFGENLAETLRAAKAVTKSGTEIKQTTQPKPRIPPQTNYLNGKSPAPARRQPGVQRGREAAPPRVSGPSARYNRNNNHNNASKTSRRPLKPTRRR